MTRIPLFITAALLFVACNNKKVSEHTKKQIIATPKKYDSPKPTPQTHTDTLQFIHFDGNSDYWSCVFLNSSKDTITLVTDSVIADSLRNKLFEVKRFTDTLYEADDNDSKYAANRMSHFRPVNEKPFVAPVTDERVLMDISKIPEVQSGADQINIVERPADGRNYYLVETGTRETDNFSRFLMFRVYTYPKYKISVYNAGEDTELSLKDWRKK